jgi:hypothetical protein
LWTYSVGIAWLLWGFAGLFIGLIFLGIGVVPVAFVAGLVKADWVVVETLLISVFLTFGSRALGMAMQHSGVAAVPR